MSPRNQATFSSRIDRRLVAYATLAGAALSASAAADASIVYVDLSATPILIPLTTAGIYLNVVTGVNNTSPGSVPGWDLNPFSSTSLSWFAATPNASSGYIAALGSSPTLVDNLGIGTAIGPSTYVFNNASESTGATAFTLNSTNNYVGFRFLNEATTLTSFGWVQVRLGASFTDSTRAIVGYAYENSGGAILSGDTGAIPEPSTIALLGVMAAGALGVRAWRKRKAA
jgi:hypothetical protein